MYGSWIENVEYFVEYFRIHLRHIKRFNNAQLLSLSAKPTVQNHPFENSSNVVFSIKIQGNLQKTILIKKKL